MKKNALFIVLGICVLFLFSCGSESLEFDNVSEHQLKMLYKNSSAVIIATCTSFDDNLTYATMNTEKVVSIGQNKHNIDTFYCENDSLVQSQSYLVFLNGAIHGENLRFETQNFTALKIDNGRVALNKRKYSIDSVTEQLEKYKDIICVQPHVYFFSKREDLIQNSDDIVIGKLVSSPERNDKTIYSATDTTSLQQQVACVEMDIRVISSLRGDLEHDDIIHTVYIPDSLSSMTDMTTLNTVSINELSVISLRTDYYYVFFLIHSADEKQDHFLLTNPIQGVLELKNDELSCSDKNTLFADCDKLRSFVVELNKNK